MDKQPKTQCLTDEEIRNFSFISDHEIKDKLWKTQVLNILKREKLLTADEAKLLENLNK